MAPDGGNICIGFAIPSNMVKNLTKQIVEFGQVKRGEIGILGTELTPELSTRAGYRHENTTLFRVIVVQTHNVISSSDFYTKRALLSEGTINTVKKIASYENSKPWIAHAYPFAFYFLASLSPD